MTYYRAAQRVLAAGASFFSRLPGLVLVMLLILSLVLTACSGDLPKGAVAQVGQVVISQDAFDSLRGLYEAAGRAPDKKSRGDEYERFEQAVAEYLVTMEILKQEALAYKVDITDSMVQQKVAEMKRMFQGDDKKFEEALKKQNIDLKQFTQQTRDRVLLDAMKAAVTADVAVTETEVEAYYEAHKADYVQPEERQTRHILIAVGDSNDSNASEPAQADWDVAQSEAAKIRGEIQNGADFATVARKYSDDADTKEAGGKLGPITRGQMAPTFEDAVFSLKKGEVSEPIRTQYGYHLIQVTDITPEEQLAYERVKEAIRTALLEQETAQVWKAWLADRKAALGVVYAAGLKPKTSDKAPATTTTEKAPSDDTKDKTGGEESDETTSTTAEE